MTWEQLGTIVSFAHELHGIGAHFADAAEKLTRTSLEDLECIIREGEQVSVPQYDKSGRQNYPDTGLMGAHVEKTYFRVDA